jgi:ferritin-like protein
MSFFDDKGFVGRVSSKEQTDFAQDSSEGNKLVADTRRLLADRLATLGCLATITVFYSISECQFPYLPLLNQLQQVLGLFSSFSLVWNSKQQ